jgi:hypothetical protein
VQSSPHPQEPTTDENPSTKLAAIIQQVMVGKVNDRLVLLGAGASVEAGMPDGRTLAAKLTSTAKLSYFKEILDHLSDRGFPDVERAFSVLDAIADIRRDSPSLMRDLMTCHLLREPWCWRCDFLIT